MDPHAQHTSLGASDAGAATVLARLRRRPEIRFFATLPAAGTMLTAVWWTIVALHGVLPALLAIVTGLLVAAVQGGNSLAWPLTIVGVVYVLVQVITPVQTAVSHTLGDRLANVLYGRLIRTTISPPGMAHLEDPALVADLTVARDFDLGITGPPLSYSMDFIAGGLVGTIGGVASALVLFGFSWWAPIVLTLAWASTHWLLRESAVWFDRNTDEVKRAQRIADYTYRLAVDAPASKELRLFGLVGWTLDRFVATRTHLHRLQYEATRLRERPLAWCILIVSAANLSVAWALASATTTGGLPLGSLVIYAQCLVGTSLIAFGGLNWALDGAAAPVAAVTRLQASMASAGALSPGTRPAPPRVDREIRFRDVTFAYPGGAPILDGFDLTIPAGQSLAIVGQNGAGKTTLAKLVCRFYEPQRGVIEIDGVDLRELDVTSWRARLSAVFQDFLRLELPLRDNVAPDGAPDDVIRQALERAGAAGLASLDTVLARGYAGGTELSGGQWQRVALARTMCAVDRGARIVLLDEPTAQLDVGGEAEIFERLLAATKGCTTILISHRFSTVRKADRIAVLERGRIVELGSHDELIALRGRYHTMFELQAGHFESEDEEGRRYDVLA